MFVARSRRQVGSCTLYLIELLTDLMTLKILFTVYGLQSSSPAAHRSPHMSTGLLMYRCSCRSSYGGVQTCG